MRREGSRLGGVGIWGLGADGADAGAVFVGAAVSPFGDAGGVVVRGDVNISAFGGLHISGFKIGDGLLV